MSGEPFPKSAQLARGERRRFRKVAKKVEWIKLRRAKLGPCRACGATWANELHHVIKRSHGGDDVPANLVPVCHVCHAWLHRRDPVTVRSVIMSLTDSEYAYAVESGGEDVWERAYGVRYER